jgi:hypothetical protein
MDARSIDMTHTEQHAGKRAAPAARLAEHRVQALGLQPVRHDGPHEHRLRAGRRRRRAPHPRHAKGIAATVDCNGRYVYLNPRRGAQIAVAEAARNLVCVGARPRAITNNLNFGNPLKPEVYYQLREAVLGMGEACRAFETPVTGGNVSLYNENPKRRHLPDADGRHGRRAG